MSRKRVVVMVPVEVTYARTPLKEDAMVKHALSLANHYAATSGGGAGDSGSYDWRTLTATEAKVRHD